MKLNLICAIFSILILSCNEPAEKEIVKPLTTVFTALEVPSKIIDKSALIYNNKNSLWTLNDTLFSGHAVSYFPDHSVMQKFGILNGKKQNESLDYYPDGKLKHVANYHKGKLHGEKKSWSPDSTHVLVSHLNYHSGKAHGVQKKWYATGEIFKILQLDMGKEEGIQQAYRKNGVLFANYEARNGRTFGLRKAALCYGLDDEKIKMSKPK